MPHIHTQPGQHDLTVSTFIVRTDTPEPTLLLHMHKKLGKLLQFGGHSELHETPWQAMIHELREESGYDPDQLLLVQPKTRIKRLTGVAMHPLPFVFHTVRFSPDLDHYHSDLAYLALASEPPRNQVAEKESSDIRLLTLKEILVLPESEIFQNVRETCIFVLEHAIDKEWDLVPATEFAT